MVTTIEKNGQLKLPQQIQNKYNLKTGDKIEFYFDEFDNVYFHTISSSIKRLKNIAPTPKRPVSIEEMQDAIEQETGKI